MQLLRHTEGAIVIWSDCIYTVLGFQNQRWRLQLARHYELWRELGEMAALRDISIKWTKAHVLPKHIRTGQAQLANVLGNAVADLVAKHAAQFESVSAAEEANIGFVEGRAHLIRMRLVAIQRVSFETTGSTPPVERRAMQTRPAAADERKRRTVRGVKRDSLEREIFQGHPSHRVTIQRDHFICKRCGARAACGASPKLRSLAKECRGRPMTPYFRRVLDQLCNDRPSSWAKSSG